MKARIRSRLKILTLCVGAAVVQLAAAAAQADTGVGVDTVLGNALNPGTGNTMRDRDPAGLSGQPQTRRTPTGQLYELPYLPVTPKATESGWTYSGSVEAGVLGGDANEKNATFRMYKDLDNGLYLNNFEVEAEKADEARFVEAVGGGVGRNDQYFGVEFGRYNDWKVEAFYNETPHVFTSTYRSLWSGLGTDNLTLNALTPGGTTSAAVTGPNIVNALAATENSELSLVRKKGGVRYDTNLSDAWKFFGSYSNEKREGARPFAAVFGGGGGGGNVEIPESIDYNTHDLLAGLRYSDSLTSLNLQVAASLFRNNIDTMTFDNPLFITTNTIAGVPATTFTQGRYDLYPDNDYYNAKGEYARALPDFYSGRFTAVASLSRLRQNDNLIPPSMYPLTGGTINGVSTADNWNTTAALSKSSADAEINIRLLDLGLALNPTDALNVKGKVRYYETKNSTEYWACNPLTGQWGRLLNDGSGGNFPIPNATAGNNPVGTLNTAYNAAGCNLAATQALGLVPSAGNGGIRNIPFDYKQFNYTLGADYRVSTASSLNATFEREEYEREYRERDKTWEDKLKLGYTNRGIEDGTVRASYERTNRRGSEYHPDPYDPFFSTSLGPLPTATGTNVASWIHIMDSFRKFDLADRDQNILNARFNYMVATDLDVGVALQYKDARYPDSAYGRNDRQKQNSLSLDLNYQPSAEVAVYGFYSYQASRMHQTGLQANACVIGTTYNFLSNGAVQTTALTAAQIAAGITIVSTTTVTAADFLAVCGAASDTSPLYPTSRTWDVTSEDRNDTLGMGLRYDFGKAKLDLNYTYSTSRTQISYGYNAAALGLTAAQEALIGSGMPDLEFKQQILDASLLVPISKAAATRLFYRYEKGTIRDWHYDGVAQNPVPATNAVYLDAGPQDYKASVVGLFLQVAF
ncbi:MAG: hypothetical protein A2151_06245 [Candidatus Muproteobacteria bacterium RBG_16_65_34]|uniref:MtrB/PioB family decaheme-associated outer membrane protein n=1 Tax=Candidatus Muproteobacteria bacterium RBG_16_65_34 TaxID=1817760 RepID=A0A1F6TUY7_9PROT|nr:MAG: hypothetical protein A2151_06245 [Candidatus Muproteobacteria bacterium RBG_16_65_34]